MSAIFIRHWKTL